MAKKGNITCVDCKTEHLKGWQVSPAIDLPGEQYRCGKCSVAHNTAVAK